MHVLHGIQRTKMFAVLLLAAGHVAAVPAAEPAGVAAQGSDAAAWAALQQLAGDWLGQAEAGGDSTPMTVRFEVASGGKAVIERMFADTPHEMLTVYYLADGELRATHFCAAGNQPAFRLAPDASATKLDFEFDGGTGFDPAADSHVHDGHIHVLDANRIDMRWNFHEHGKPSGSVQSVLTRQ